MSLGLDKERPAIAVPPDEDRKKLLCINCEHHTVIDVGVLVPLAHVCKVEGLFDQVDGKPLYRRCATMRNSSDLCGPYATKFQPKSE